MQPILSQDAQSKTQVNYEDAKDWDPQALSTLNQGKSQKLSFNGN